MSESSFWPSNHLKSHRGDLNELKAKISDLHVDDERMIDAEQDILLVLNVLHLFESDDVSDGQDLEGPVLAGALLTAQHHAAERTRSCRICISNEKKKHKT